eukprot:339360_1
MSNSVNSVNCINPTIPHSISNRRKNSIISTLQLSEIDITIKYDDGGVEKVASKDKIASKDHEPLPKEKKNSENVQTPQISDKSLENKSKLKLRVMDGDKNKNELQITKFDVESPETPLMHIYGMNDISYKMTVMENINEKMNKISDSNVKCQTAI